MMGPRLDQMTSTSFTPTKTRTTTSSTGLKASEGTGDSALAGMRFEAVGLPTAAGIADDFQGGEVEVGVLQRGSQAKRWCRSPSARPWRSRALPLVLASAVFGMVSLVLLCAAASWPCGSPPRSRWSRSSGLSGRPVPVHARAGPHHPAGRRRTGHHDRPAGQPGDRRTAAGPVDDLAVRDLPAGHDPADPVQRRRAGRDQSAHGRLAPPGRYRLDPRHRPAPTRSGAARTQREPRPRRGTAEAGASSSCGWTAVRPADKLKLHDPVTLD